MARNHDALTYIRAGSRVGSLLDKKPSVIVSYGGGASGMPLGIVILSVSQSATNFVNDTSGMSEQSYVKSVFPVARPDILIRDPSELWL